MFHGMKLSVKVVNSLNFRTQHQVIFMKDIEPYEMEYLIKYIYLGEVEIPNKDVERIIKMSQELGIVGLKEVKCNEQETESRETPKVAKRKLDSSLDPETTKMAKIESKLYEDHDLVDTNGHNIDNMEEEEDDENEDKDNWQHESVDEDEEEQEEDELGEEECEEEEDDEEEQVE